MSVPDLLFPPDFRWGTATAAHQVEGQLHNDWSEWETIPGKIRDGTTSNDSCDWWAGRFHEDFDLAQGMANNALRLSVEWSRIEPREGEWDPAAIDRYRAMLTALRQRGIEPMVTLFHFTSPLWLMSSGGWEANSVVARFERFAARCAEAFGDLVDLWCTINEPNVYATYSYLVGLWPPQQKSMRLCLRVLRNQLLAHAAAYHAIHRLQPSARIGLAQHLRVFDPFNPNSVLDRWAARLQDALFNRLVLDPPATGRLPFPLGLNRPVAGLLDSQDFIGVNYYSRDMASFDITQPGLLFRLGRDLP
jgi:beta-glucosidase